MKVSGPGGLSQPGAAKAAPRAAGEAFRIVSTPAAGGAGQASSVSATASVMGVDALIALQDVGGPLERRRRSVGRAGRILDVLDGIRISLLGGDLSGAQLDNLARAIREQRAATDDPKLEGLLDEIETRAAVELAKLEGAARAA
jgi:hypothetical protein